MITILSALVSLLSFRVRSRASLELEVVALRHQVAVLRRQRSGRLRLFCADRLLWVWLYRIWPRALHAMVLVKPATVVQWHRRGFRLYWRWRSRSRQIGRPKTSTEIRQLIRQMSMANPIWGAPRIHGELLMLGIEVSQATVGRYMPWRPKVPSPTWRSFLRNHMRNMAAVDMFVVATATFRLLYTLIVLGHDRRRIIHFEVTQNPTQVWLARQMTEAFPWDTAPRYLLRDRDASYGRAFPRSRRGDGNQGGRDCSAIPHRDIDEIRWRPRLSCQFGKHLVPNSCIVYRAGARSRARCLPGRAAGPRGGRCRPLAAHV